VTSLVDEVGDEGRTGTEHVERVCLVDLRLRLIQQRVPNTLFVTGEVIKLAKANMQVVMDADRSFPT
jgi:hypothetical protein